MWVSDTPTHTHLVGGLRCIFIMDALGLPDKRRENLRQHVHLSFAWVIEISTLEPSHQTRPDQTIPNQARAQHSGHRADLQARQSMCAQRAIRRTHPCPANTLDSSSDTFRFELNGYEINKKCINSLRGTRKRVLSICKKKREKERERGERKRLPQKWAP